MPILRSKEPTVQAGLRVCRLPTIALCSVSGPRPVASRALILAWRVGPNRFGKPVQARDWFYARAYAGGGWRGEMINASKLQQGWRALFSRQPFRAFRASFPAPLRPGPTGQNAFETGRGRKKSEKSFASHYALAREDAGFKFLSGLTLCPILCHLFRHHFINPKPTGARQ